MTLTLNCWRSLALTLVPFLGAAISLRAQVYACPGTSVGSDKGGLQDWILVDRNNPKATIRGRLLKNALNTGPIATHDWDLNLVVMPAPGYERYAVNCLGKTNSGESDLGSIGQIEFETKIIADALGDRPDHNFRAFLARVFPVGTQVEARGYWVHDRGHTFDNPKTELHPILSLSDGNGGILVADDISERFTVHNDETHYFAFPLAVRLDTMLVPQGESRRASESFVNVVDEEAMMDISTSGSRSLLIRELIGNPPHSYQMRVDVGPPHPPAIGEKNYIPFLLAKIRQATQHSFSDTVTKTVTTCGALGWPSATCDPNQLVLQVSIVSRLSGVHPGSVEWRVQDDRAPSSGGRLSELRSFVAGATGGERVEFKRYYSPAAGKPWHDWSVAMTASTATDLLDVVPNKAAQGTSSYQFLFKQRSYSIEPSYIIVASDELRPVAPQGPPSWRFQTQCSDAEGHLSAESHLLPGVNELPGSFNWEVANVAEDADTATWVSLSEANDPWVGNGFTIDVDDANPRRLHWVSTAMKQSVAVRATQRTTLGENIEGLTRLTYGCWVTSGPSQMLESIFKALAAIDKLKQQNRLPPDPGKFVNGLNGQRVTYRTPELDEPTRILGRLSGSPRLAMQAYFRIAAGLPVTPAEIDSLGQFAMQGSRIAWAAPPPPSAITFMRQNAFRPRLRR